MNCWAGSLLGAGLVVLGSILLCSRRIESYAPPRRRQAATDQDRTLRRNAQSIIERTGTATRIDAIRVKLGFPPEVFDTAVYPVIEGYGEFVQLLPIPKSRHPADSGELFTASIEVACIALDFRRHQILPPGAVPEAIGEQAQRWTYAVFMAALLRDVETHVAELQVALGNGQALRQPWCSLIESLGASRPPSDHAHTAGGRIGKSELNGTASMLLVRGFVPAVVVEWLGADAALMRELELFLSGNDTAHVGVIETLVRRAEVVAARRHGPKGLRAPRPSRNERGDAGASDIAFRCQIDSATPAPGSDSAEPADRHAAVTADPGTRKPAPRPFTEPPINKLEYLEDFDVKCGAVASGRGGLSSGRALAP